MVAFPSTPIPASVHAPVILDPVLRFSTDAGYETRRSRWPHSLRQYLLEYKGLTTPQMRALRAFLQTTVRGAALSFTWTHPTAAEVVTADNGSPVTLTFGSSGHPGVQSGEWLFCAGINGTVNGAHQVASVTSTTVTLLGVNGGGGGTGTAAVYLPVAGAMLGKEDVIPEPVKLIGPEKNALGIWNWSLSIEERF